MVYKHRMKYAQSTVLNLIVLPELDFNRVRVFIQIIWEKHWSRSIDYVKIIN